MNINDLKESKYLTKTDVEPAVTLVVKGFHWADVEKDDGSTQKLYIMEFENSKPMVLKTTNAQLAAMALGSEVTEDWIGKQLTLWNDKSVSYGSKITGGIRIKPDSPTPQGEAAPAQPVDEMNDTIPF